MRLYVDLYVCLLKHVGAQCSLQVYECVTDSQTKFNKVEIISMKKLA